MGLFGYLRTLLLFSYGTANFLRSLSPFPAFSLMLSYWLWMYTRSVAVTGLYPPSIDRYVVLSYCSVTFKYIYFFIIILDPILVSLPSFLAKRGFHWIEIGSSAVIQPEWCPGYAYLVDALPVRYSLFRRHCLWRFTN